MRAQFVLVLAFIAGCGGQAAVGTTQEGLGLLPSRSTRIAVVGAGPSGLTAAYTLKQQGYTNVTVFEKNGRVGGKVYSWRNGNAVSELGAVFASPDYKLVLGLADKYQIPYVPYTLGQSILDERGQRQTLQSFLTSRYNILQILGATVSYGAALVRYAGINLDGLFWQSADLDVPFDQFASAHGFRPIAELARAVMIGFGYGWYEDVPAAYFMKLLGWLVKIGGSQGLEPATYYTFPTGFASIWEAVAGELDVRLNSEVTAIDRTHGCPILTVNGAQLTFDAVIISAPLNKVASFMSLTTDEAALFGQVISDRYEVSLFTASGLKPEEALFFYGNANPAGINHTNVWANRDRNSPMYVAYQLVDRSITPDQITATLAADVAGQGGTFGGLLLRQEWDNYFPHVSVQSMQSGFYDQMEALQGQNNTYYVGGTLSFETVEHSARYAQTLVQAHFPPPLF
jgi:hypothetical protein